MKIKVRLIKDMTDAKRTEFFFEELLDNGQWVAIPETRMGCEGNARHCLQRELEKRRQARLSVLRRIQGEEEYDI